MQIKEPNPYGATSPDAIAQFEARRGVLLPAEYKAFLLKSNGGMPIPDVFEVPGWHGQASELLTFYGIHEDPDYSLDSNCKSYDERVPADLIPIATDSGGNNICIGWKGEREGKIYFWDHEDELDENGLFVQDYRNVYLVANSLQEFLDSLMTHEEADKRPRPKRT
ncbi:MAG: SMI1/KNR4 family protein [Polyangiaceae bacterium]|nr:SMI1/KNR4 family protein [Polyangiaceae bacterium]